MVDNRKIKYWFNAKHTFHCIAPLDSSEAAQIEAISGDSPNYYKLATSRRCRGTDDIDADDSFMQSFEMQGNVVKCNTLGCVALLGTNANPDPLSRELLALACLQKAALS